jgi:hypothetical protein
VAADGGPRHDQRGRDHQAGIGARDQQQAHPEEHPDGGGQDDAPGLEREAGSQDEDREVRDGEDRGHRLAGPAARRQLQREGGRHVEQGHVEAHEAHHALGAQARQAQARRHHPVDAEDPQAALVLRALREALREHPVERKGHRDAREADARQEPAGPQALGGQCTLGDLVSIAGGRPSRAVGEPHSRTPGPPCVAPHGAHWHGGA